MNADEKGIPVPPFVAAFARTSSVFAVAGRRSRSALGAPSSGSPSRRSPAAASYNPFGHEKAQRPTKTIRLFVYSRASLWRSFRSSGRTRKISPQRARRPQRFGRVNRKERRERKESAFHRGLHRSRGYRRHWGLSPRSVVRKTSSPHFNPNFASSGKFRHQPTNLNLDSWRA